MWPIHYDVCNLRTINRFHLNERENSMQADESALLASNCLCVGGLVRLTVADLLLFNIPIKLMRFIPFDC